jgi:hypothetical protein
MTKVVVDQVGSDLWIREKQGSLADAPTMGRHYLKQLAGGSQFSRRSLNAIDVRRTLIDHGDDLNVRGLWRIAWPFALLAQRRPGVGSISAVAQGITRWAEFYIAAIYL